MSTKIENEQIGNSSSGGLSVYKNLKYLVVGTAFGVVFVKAEIISWFRIQEMFHLQSFFMFGVIGTAILTGMLSIYIIKRFKLKHLVARLFTLKIKNLIRGKFTGA